MLGTADAEAAPRRKYRKRNGVYDPPILVRVPPLLIDLIETAAARRKVSRSVIIREAMARYVGSEAA